MNGMKRVWDTSTILIFRRADFGRGHPISLFQKGQASNFGLGLCYICFGPIFLQERQTMSLKCFLRTKLKNKISKSGKYRKPSHSVKSVHFCPSKYQNSVVLQDVYLCTHTHQTVAFNIVPFFLIRKKVFF